MKRETLYDAASSQKYGGRASLNEYQNLLAAKASIGMHPLSFSFRDFTWARCVRWGLVTCACLVLCYPGKLPAQEQSETQGLLEGSNSEFGENLPYDSDLNFFPEPPDFGTYVEPQPLGPPRSRLPRANPPASKAPGGILTTRERAPFRFNVNWMPRRDVRDSTESLASQSIQTQLSFPLRIYPDGIWLATSGLKYTQLSTDAVLPVSGLSIPDQLWDISLGTFVSRTLPNGWQIGGLLSGGTASDQPFDSVDELTATSLGFLNIPAGPRDAWNFSLFYSPTSQIAFPIPGIAYVWRPNDRLEAQIGLPASLAYQPTDTFSFRARYTPLTDIFVEARKSLGNDWELYSRYQIINETYWLSDRADRDDRFFRFEQQLAAGLSRELRWGFAVDAGAAYVFDRHFFQSSDFDLNSDDMIQVKPGIAYTVQLIWTR